MNALVTRPAPIRQVRVDLSSRASITVLFMAVLMILPTVSHSLSGQSPGAWKPLFNGKDLTGWTAAAGRSGANPTAGAAADRPGWKVENGVLIGGLAPSGIR